MMRVSDLIDLPIYTLLEGKSFKHSVKSLLLDGINNRVAAFVCKEGTLKKRYQLIPYERVISIDFNGIVVPDMACIEKATLKEIHNFLQLDDILNKIVKSNNGDLYGILTDMYINPLTGRITSYELSEGYIDDLVNGRRRIDIKNNLSKSLMNKEIILYQRLN